MEAQSMIWVYWRHAIRRQCRRTHVLWLLLCNLLPFFSIGQSTGVSLARITLQDKVLERVLTDYLNESKAKVIAVYIERYDNDYTYTLRDFGLFDTVKRNPTAVFGEWKRSTLLVYSGIEVIISPLDSSAIDRIQKYLRLILPDQYSEKKRYSDGVIEDTMTTFAPIIWRFKVRDGKPLWLRKNLAYQSEKIPYLK